MFHGDLRDKHKKSTCKRHGGGGKEEGDVPMNSFKLERIGSKIALEIDRMGQNSEITRYSRQRPLQPRFTA
ncbi:hypothetical protein RRG08_059140 [Elysia crispata]|uniref:Uncharacterized protein n=1 Tax=Elysia crispata TaxID=231223 RepID=A0AAE0XXJ1_9GAST|nr:hypothetical protein RRG08_059140 [Elysia crispata]